MWLFHVRLPNATDSKAIVQIRIHLGSVDPNSFENSPLEVVLFYLWHSPSLPCGHCSRHGKLLHSFNPLFDSSFVFSKSSF